MRRCLLAFAVAVTAAAVLVFMVRRNGFRAAFEREAGAGTRRFRGARIVSEGDLAHLPQPVQKYLRYVGVMGKPAVVNFHAVLDGDFARNEQAGFMPIRAEQYNFYDRPSRLFIIESSLFGIPFEGFHRYAGTAATMRVQLARLIPLVHAAGPEMTRSETVTLFNDMCVFAPATLIDPAIRWENVDDRCVRATFTNAGNTIRAVLMFGPDGELRDFLSVDRSQTTDGTVFVRCPWSTPIRNYREFHGFRLASEGDAVWHEPSGDFTYAHFRFRDIRYNISAE